MSLPTALILHTAQYLQTSLDVVHGVFVTGNATASAGTLEQLLPFAVKQEKARNPKLVEESMRTLDLASCDGISLTSCLQDLFDSYMKKMLTDIKNYINDSPSRKLALDKHNMHQTTFRKIEDQMLGKVKEFNAKRDGVHAEQSERSMKEMSALRSQLLAHEETIARLKRDVATVASETNSPRGAGNVVVSLKLCVSTSPSEDHVSPHSSTVQQQRPKEEQQIVSTLAKIATETEEVRQLFCDAVSKAAIATISSLTSSSQSPSSGVKLVTQCLADDIHLISCSSTTTAVTFINFVESNLSQLTSTASFSSQEVSPSSGVRCGLQVGILQLPFDSEVMCVRRCKFVGTYAASAVRMLRYACHPFERVIDGGGENHSSSSVFRNIVSSSVLDRHQDASLNSVATNGNRNSTATATTATSHSSTSSSSSSNAIPIAVVTNIIEDTVLRRLRGCSIGSSSSGGGTAAAMFRVVAYSAMLDSRDPVRTALRGNLLNSSWGVFAATSSGSSNTTVGPSHQQQQQMMSVAATAALQRPMVPRSMTLSETRYLERFAAGISSSSSSPTSSHLSQSFDYDGAQSPRGRQQQQTASSAILPERGVVCVMAVPMPSSTSARLKTQSAQPSSYSSQQKSLRKSALVDAEEDEESAKRRELASFQRVQEQVTLELLDHIRESVRRHNGVEVSDSLDWRRTLASLRLLQFTCVFPTAESALQACTECVDQIREHELLTSSSMVDVSMNGQQKQFTFGSRKASLPASSSKKTTTAVRRKRKLKNFVAAAVVHDIHRKYFHRLKVAIGISSVGNLRFLPRLTNGHGGGIVLQQDHLGGGKNNNNNSNDHNTSRRQSLSSRPDSAAAASSCYQSLLGGSSVIVLDNSLECMCSADATANLSRALHLLQSNRNNNNRSLKGQEDEEEEGENAIVVVPATTDFLDCEHMTSYVHTSRIEKFNSGQLSSSSAAPSSPSSSSVFGTQVAKVSLTNFEFGSQWSGIGAVFPEGFLSLPNQLRRLSMDIFFGIVASVLKEISAGILLVDPSSGLIVFCTTSQRDALAALVAINEEVNVKKQQSSSSSSSWPESLLSMLEYARNDTLGCVGPRLRCALSLSGGGGGGNNNANNNTSNHHCYESPLRGFANVLKLLDWCLPMEVLMSREDAKTLSLDLHNVYEAVCTEEAIALYNGDELLPQGGERQKSPCSSSTTTSLAGVSGGCRLLANGYVFGSGISNKTTNSNISYSRKVHIDSLTTRDRASRRHWVTQLSRDDYIRAVCVAALSGDDNFFSSTSSSDLLLSGSQEEEGGGKASSPHHPSLISTHSSATMTSSSSTTLPKEINELMATLIRRSWRPLEVLLRPSLFTQRRDGDEQGMSGITTTTTCTSVTADDDDDDDNGDADGCYEEGGNGVHPLSESLLIRRHFHLREESASRQPKQQDISIATNAQKEEPTSSSSASVNGTTKKKTTTQQHLDGFKFPVLPLTFERYSVLREGYLSATSSSQQRHDDDGIHHTTTSNHHRSSVGFNHVSSYSNSPSFVDGRSCSPSSSSLAGFTSASSSGSSVIVPTEVLLSMDVSIEAARAVHMTVFEQLLPKYLLDLRRKNTSMVSLPLPPLLSSSSSSSSSANDTSSPRQQRVNHDDGSRLRSGGAGGGGPRVTFLQFARIYFSSCEETPDELFQHAEEEYISFTRNQLSDKFSEFDRSVPKRTNGTSPLKQTAVTPTTTGGGGNVSGLTRKPSFGFGNRSNSSASNSAALLAPMYLSMQNTIQFYERVCRTLLRESAEESLRGLHTFLTHGRTIAEMKVVIKHRDLRIMECEDQILQSRKDLAEVESRASEVSHLKEELKTQRAEAISEEMKLKKQIASIHYSTHYVGKLLHRIFDDIASKKKKKAMEATIQEEGECLEGRAAAAGAATSSPPSSPTVNEALFLSPEQVFDELVILFDSIQGDLLNPYSHVPPVPPPRKLSVADVEALNSKMGLISASICKGTTDLDDGTSAETIVLSSIAQLMKVAASLVGLWNSSDADDLQQVQGSSSHSGQQQQNNTTMLGAAAGKVHGQPLNSSSTLQQRRRSSASSVRGLSTAVSLARRMSSSIMHRTNNVKDDVTAAAAAADVSGSPSSPLPFDDDDDNGIGVMSIESNQQQQQSSAHQDDLIDMFRSSSFHGGKKSHDNPRHAMLVENGTQTSSSLEDDLNVIRRRSSAAAAVGGERNTLLPTTTLGATSSTSSSLALNAMRNFFKDRPALSEDTACVMCCIYRAEVVCEGCWGAAFCKDCNYVVHKQIPLSVQDAALLPHNGALLSRDNTVAASSLHHHHHHQHHSANSVPGVVDGNGYHQAVVAAAYQRHHGGPVLNVSTAHDPRTQRNLRQQQQKRMLVGSGVGGALFRPVEREVRRTLCVSSAPQVFRSRSPQKTQSTMMTGTSTSSSQQDNDHRHEKSSSSPLPLRPSSSSRRPLSAAAATIRAPLDDGKARLQRCEGYEDDEEEEDKLHGIIADNDDDDDDDDGDDGGQMNVTGDDEGGIGGALCDDRSSISSNGSLLYKFPVGSIKGKYTQPLRAALGGGQVKSGGLSSLALQKKKKNQGQRRPTSAMARIGTTTTTPPPPPPSTLKIDRTRLK